MPAKTVNDLIEEAKAFVNPVTVEAVNNAISDGKKIIFLDVREKEETSSGIIPNSLLIPRGILEFLIEIKVPDKSSEIIIYCAKGPRSLLAANLLKSLGYNNVSYLDGGFENWIKEGLGRVK